MSIGPMSGIPASAAGAPLSQTSGSETERAQRDSSSQQRQAASTEKADKAAGIGQTEQDEGTSERDADGRRFWETTEQSTEEEVDGQHDEQQSLRQAKDPLGNSGGMIDLTG